MRGSCGAWLAGWLGLGAWGMLVLCLVQCAAWHGVSGHGVRVAATCALPSAYGVAGQHEHDTACGWDAEEIAACCSHC